MADIQGRGREVPTFTGGGMSSTAKRKEKEGREELKILGGRVWNYARMRLLVSFDFFFYYYYFIKAS
jgi:hypothetical protein